LGAKLLDVRATGRQFVDRYELVGEIASGGMATVFLARLTGVGGFQRLYAVKRLHPHLQADEEFVEMFLDEARLAAGIHHPNVVPILEVGASQNSHYLVMEYIEGDTLARLLARAASDNQRIPAPQAIRIALDTLSGLHAAHELRDENGLLAGVVHRDVSPQNVLVGVDGVSRITDCGVARAASRLSATRVGQLKGKIAYMAPEQARGEIDLDRRADVFAAGIVFWEALAHRRLFKAQNEAGTLARVLQEPIPDLHMAAPHLSPVVCRVVMRALERDRDRRIGTCAEFADALERAAQSTGEIGSPRDLKRYMDAVIGQDVRAQREAVRAWTARADSLAPPSQLTPTGGATNTGLETVQRQERTQPSSGRGRSLGASLAMLLFGAGVYVVYDQLTAEEESPPLPAAAEAPSLSTADAEQNEVGVAEEGAVTQKKSDPDALTLSEVVEDEAKAKQEPEVVAPAPRPAASRDRSKSGTAPASKPRPRPKKSAVDDALDSNPYR